MLVTYSIGQIIDAIEKNGYPKAKYYYHKEEFSYNGTLHTYCSLGQASLNLGLECSIIGQSLKHSEHKIGNELWHRISELNDKGNMTLPRIAARLRVEYSDHLEDIIHIEPS